jgi:AcrR family transcriptional regulator
MPRKNYHHGNLKNALIAAGMKIISKEGLGGLSLRKVAKKAGVSPTAPYAHFKDKQALIAAISTLGYHHLYDQLTSTVSLHVGDPQSMLIEVGWSYVQFALSDPERFKVMFSGILEQEKDYPEFREMALKNFELLVTLVVGCQEAGLLTPGPADMIAVRLWSVVHGFVTLLLEGQISHTLLNRISIRDLLIFMLNEVTKLEDGVLENSSTAPKGLLTKS